jgi:hypothetical protein
MTLIAIKVMSAVGEQHRFRQAALIGVNLTHLHAQGLADPSNMTNLQCLVFCFSHLNQFRGTPLF